MTPDGHRNPYISKFGKSCAILVEFVSRDVRISRYKWNMAYQRISLSGVACQIGARSAMMGWAWYAFGFAAAPCCLTAIRNRHLCDSLPHVHLYPLFTNALPCPPCRHPLHIITHQHSVAVSQYSRYILKIDLFQDLHNTRWTAVEPLLQLYVLRNQNGSVNNLS